MTQPLDRAFNAAVLHIASRLLPCGFDVGVDAPSTLEAIKGYHAKTGRIKVWNGASDKTIFGDNEVNYAFRAWHDWAHLTGNLPFTFEGECRAATVQQDHLMQLYGAGRVTPQLAPWLAIINAEVVEQAAHYEATGQFARDQRAFDLNALHRAGFYLDATT